MANERAERTIEILIRAFIMDDLAYMDYRHCAVGTLGRADGQGFRETLKVGAIGYSSFEIDRIHDAFERTKDLPSFKPSDTFPGLSAVFDRLTNELDKDYFAARSPIRITSNSLEVGVER